MSTPTSPAAVLRVLADLAPDSAPVTPTFIEPGSRQVLPYDALSLPEARRRSA